MGVLEYNKRSQAISRARLLCVASVEWVQALSAISAPSLLHLPWVLLVMINVFVRALSSKLGVGVLTLLGCVAGNFTPLHGSETRAMLEKLTVAFSQHDFDSDSIAEIERLALPSWSESAELQSVSGPLLIVLVESRLLNEIPKEEPTTAELQARLSQYEQALRADGWNAWLVEARLYSGEVHQDGKTVLALRRFLQQLRVEDPSLAGVVMIGSFPEASLVRRWIWKHDSRPATFNGVPYNRPGTERATFVAMDPELIAPRTDVVLSDLDGAWESLYHQERTEIESLRILPAVEEGQEWPKWDEPLTAMGYTSEAKSFEDFFWIEDCEMEISDRSKESLTLRASYEPRRPELASADRQQTNPIARPEISVSRINPLHVAVIASANDTDDEGKPRAVGADEGSPLARLVRSPILERRLLIEYLDRNLAYRTGDYPVEAQRSALLTTDLQTMNGRYFRGISESFQPTIEMRRATTVDMVRFLQTPALVKGISAHSDAGCSMLIPGYDASELDRLTGGSYWHWELRGESYEPVYADSAIRDLAHFGLLRTLWENGSLRSAGPAFYLHAGCEVNTPVNADRVPYNAPEYATHVQIGENFLFYANGLALMSRAKVFYDAPRGFAQALGRDRGTFGSALEEYFRQEASDASMAADVAGYNRVYFWSILGDWTLRQVESSR